MRSIGVVTVGRSDYGIYRSLLHALAAEPGLELRLYVTGMHLAPEFGATVAMIEADGFPICERIETLLGSDSPESIGKAMGLGVIGFSQAFARVRPDVLVVLGDRFDMYPAALAALPFRIPVAHVHGGEVTAGAIDDALRHSITKFSHLHFVATEQYGRRVVQLGEEPWRVTVSGAPALDDLETEPRLSAGELEARFGIALSVPPLLVTFHPVTLEHEQNAVADRRTARGARRVAAARHFHRSQRRHRRAAGARGDRAICRRARAGVAGRELRAAGLFQYPAAGGGDGRQFFERDHRGGFVRFAGGEYWQPAGRAHASAERPAIGPLPSGDSAGDQAGGGAGISCGALFVRESLSQDSRHGGGGHRGAAEIRAARRPFGWQKVS